MCKLERVIIRLTLQKADGTQLRQIITKYESFTNHFRICHAYLSILPPTYHLRTILLMATGIPELLAKFLLPEKLVLALLDTVSLVGMKFALTSKYPLRCQVQRRQLFSYIDSHPNGSLFVPWLLVLYLLCYLFTTSMSAKSDHRVTCVGLSWSLVNSLGNSLVIIWKLIKSSEYSLRFFYFCLNSNLSVVGFLCNSCLVQMYLKFKQTPKQLYYLIASYIFLFPILST
eukprot:XP_763119.1 hypothetical protein [Theileria parva strain Muguga]